MLILLKLSELEHCFCQTDLSCCPFLCSLFFRSIKRVLQSTSQSLLYAKLQQCWSWTSCSQLRSLNCRRQSELQPGVSASGCRTQEKSKCGGGVVRSVFQHKRGFWEIAWRFWQRGEATDSWLVKEGPSWWSWRRKFNRFWINPKWFH